MRLLCSLGTLAVRSAVAVATSQPLIDHHAPGDARDQEQGQRSTGNEHIVRHKLPARWRGSSAEPYSPPGMETGQLCSTAVHSWYGF